jgi:hypothetical protein
MRTPRYVPDLAARATRLLVAIRDRIELGQRPDDHAERTRQTLIDLAELARLIRKMAERP